MNDVQRIIIDTDMSVDDWMAILNMMNRPRVDMRVIMVMGTGEAHYRAGNAQRPQLDLPG